MRLPSLPLLISTLWIAVGGLFIAAPAATIQVRAGDDLQAAINQAHLGDTIVLDYTATFTGPFDLPKPRTPGTGPVTIETSRLDLLPGAGARIDPSYSGKIPKLIAPAKPGYVIAAQPGASDYRFIGLEIAPARGAFLYNVVMLGTGTEKSTDDVPHNISFDRCWMHGDPKAGSRRAIAMNGANITVMNSYLSDLKETGADSQAICGWNGPGPFTITNNYLEAAGENVLFGGEDPAIPDLVPSDITITGNLFSKPLSWRVGDPSYTGTHWVVKNLFELKNANNVTVDRNIFEHCWADSQKGSAILITPRNQGGKAPWSVVQNIRFTNNIVRHAASGIDILGWDDIQKSQQANHILISNNLFSDISTRWGGTGRFALMVNGSAYVTMDHNTVEQAAAIIFADAKPSTHFVFTNNVVRHNACGRHNDSNNCGMAGSGSAPGEQSIRRYFPGAVIMNNVIYGTGRKTRLNSKWLAANYPRKNRYLDGPDGQGGAGIDAGVNMSMLPAEPARGPSGHDPSPRQEAQSL